MYGICLRYAKNRDDADDIFQQGFYLVYKNIDQLKNNDALSGWIKRIFVNSAIEFNRKINQMIVVEDNEMNLQDSLIDVNQALSNLAVDELTKLIQQLPKGCRKVFNLYMIEGLSHKEIAEKLNISESTSKSQLYEARNTLKKKIINRTGIEKKVSH
ncbi:MAG: sigma-70 family RNA polymerase sigma factor [Flavobacteriales bacterium]|nr:sigma-70 family RNA polymerase sigma factor [Flavobacteriales bacterium]